MHVDSAAKEYIYFFSRDQSRDHDHSFLLCGTEMIFLLNMLLV